MTDKLKVLIDELAMITHHESTPNPVSQMLAAVLIALRELAQPAVEAAEIEVAAREIYESWQAIDGYVAWVPGGNSHMQDNARRLARRILAGVNQQAGCGWVAVRERLPDSKGFVLVRSGQDTDISTGTILAYYSPLDGKFHSTHYATTVYCSHWMPLPPSPAAKAVQS